MIGGCHDGADTKRKPEAHQASAPQYAGTMTDIDGNTYRTVRIGRKVWMAENLKVTHYSNGDAVSHISDSGQWRDRTTGAWCTYNNDEKNVALYGLLYNWHALADRRKLAPKGWHIPTDAEWRTLMQALGGVATAGGKMKTGKHSYWQQPGNDDGRAIGFGALPGGGRNNNGVDDNAGFSATWWSATTEAYADFAITYNITGNSNVLKPDTDDRNSGFSVRCIQN